jgi:hypothetical protein
MPGPTTEALNDDVKELRDDLHRIDVGLTEILTELKVLVGVATWGIGIIATTLIGGVWWASATNSEVKHLGIEIAEVRKTQAQQGEVIAAIERSTLPTKIPPAPRG